jgi:hypothetical protein
LTIDDRRDAQTLSHEIAEMVVDPHANMSNPEVCDGCAGNCSNVWNNFFDGNNKFIAGSKNVPPTFNYSYFINSFIRPESCDPATTCATSGSDLNAVCVYDVVQLPDFYTWTLNQAKNWLRHRGGSLEDSASL